MIYNLFDTLSLQHDFSFEVLAHSVLVRILIYILIYICILIHTAHHHFVFHV